MTLKNNLEQGGEFQTVELDGTSPAISIFYIENSSQIKSTVALLLVFILLHILAAWRSPNLLSLKHEYFAFNKTEGVVSVDMDIILSSLLPTHKFVNVNGSIIRNTNLDSAPLSLPIEYSVKTDFLYNQTLKNVKEVNSKEVTLSFGQGEKNSSEYEVLEEEITDFDTLQIKVTVKSNVTEVSGFLFSWSFANMSAAKYKRIACILTSFLIGYMLVIFCSFINLETEAFTQIFCIIIGAMGIISSNPIALFLSPIKSARISDHVLMTAFLAFYRLFLITQLEMVRAHSTSPKIILLIILGLYFAFYSTINAAANYDRANFILSSQTVTDIILPTEKLLIELHITYTIICIVWIILAIKQSNGYTTRRMYLFIFFTLLDLTGTLVSEVLFPILHVCMFSILPSMIIASTHVTTAAFSIFFLHNGSDPDYTQMDDQNQKGGSLDIEELSDNELLDDTGKNLNHDDDENDEEEEEEEEEE